MKVHSIKQQIAIKLQLLLHRRESKDQPYEKLFYAQMGLKCSFTQTKTHEFWSRNKVTNLSAQHFKTIEVNN